MTTANQMQVGGDHYRNAIDGSQHWDFMLANFGCSYLVGCATKYIVRWRKKNGIEDLKKAAHYVKKMHEAASDKLVEPLPETTRISLRHFFDANDVGEWEREMMARIVRWQSPQDLQLIHDDLMEKIDG